jgi:hypothetical protein
MKLAWSYSHVFYESCTDEGKRADPGCRMGPQPKPLEIPRGERWETGKLLRALSDPGGGPQITTSQLHRVRQEALVQTTSPIDLRFNKK